MVSPEMQKLAAERAARMQAANDLKEPDRVPFRGLGGDVVAAFAGITAYEYEFDFAKSREAALKWLKEFPSDSPMMGAGGLDLLPMAVAFSDFPDLAGGFMTVNGPMNDILKMKFGRFPGRELDEYSSKQFIGRSNMGPEEYDELIANPQKFSYEKVLPRLSDNFKDMSSPTALATLARAGLERVRQGAEMAKTVQSQMELGFPFGPGGGLSYAPLDYIGDHLRDIPNTVMDLRRYPDKVKAAAESILEVLFKMATANKNAKSITYPLHLNEYLSPKLYQEFYWPTLRSFILRLAEKGIRAGMFCEGWHDPHLETVLDLPAGWGSCSFEKTDVRKAKEVLKGHTCISGGIDVGVIISGTPAIIDEYIKKLLDDMMPGGGYILGPNVGNLPRNTPLENVHAVYEAVEKYGKY
ncbi:MAG TPA: uroporphyrinogen decarboxylase family protein [Oscillospiraceae bacterium]|nr:uroporphyrinogen decarboxylase family protein [Oscillospiraceae bacterium]